jgi:rod shape-determining protein MreC
MPKKNFFLFFLLIVVSLVLMTYQSKKSHFFSGNHLKNLLNTASSASKSFTDSLKSPFRKLALRQAENQRLRKEIDNLLLEREKFQEAMLENRRLKEFLQLRETRKNYIATAKIISRGLDHWANILVIDKGTKDGVLKDMSVITPRGLAGKIISSTGSYSTMLSLTDINFSAAVRLQEGRKEGIISGTGKRKCILKYIPYEEEVKTGDIIITSGLDSFFPAGIPVGSVSSVDTKGTGGYFQDIEVLPFQDDSRIEEVVIVK